MITESAAEAVEKRINRLLSTCDSKRNIRKSIEKWFATYTSSKEYQGLSQKNKAEMVSMYTGIILFFE